MIHWDSKIHSVPRALLPVNHCHMWSMVTHFRISLYWFVPVDCYFAIISLSLTTLSAWLYQLFLVWIQYFLSNNQWMCLPTISCQIRYFDSANTEQPLLICITISLDLLHNLHISDKSWLSICFFEFTCSGCSCAGHIIASVSFFKFSPFNRFDVLLVLTFFVSFRNLPWRGFYSHWLVFFSFKYFVNTPESSTSDYPFSPAADFNIHSSLSLG